MAFVSGGVLVIEQNVGVAGAHARWLLKSVSDIMAEAGADIGEVDLIALATGPGSFTGLRIGVSVAKGLAWSLGVDVAGVSTLEALAINAGSTDLLVCPVLDARRGEVYGALYSFNGKDAEPILVDNAYPPEAFIKSVSEASKGRRVLFLGPGLAAYGGMFKEAFPDAEFAERDLWNVRAVSIARLAERGRATVLTPAELAPTYLRRSVAEEKLDAETGG